MAEITSEPGLWWPRRLLRRSLTLDRNFKVAIALSVDLVCGLVALPLSLWLRGVEFSATFFPYGLVPIMVYPGVLLGCLMLFGVYRAVLRHLGPATYRSLFLAFCLGAGVMVPLGMALDYAWPRSLYVLYPLVFFLLAASVRFIGQRTFFSVASAVGRRRAVAIYGAGSAGATLASVLKASGQYRITGFYDDDTGKWGSRIGGLKVNAPAALFQGDGCSLADELIVAIPSLSTGQRRALFDRLDGLTCRVRTVPPIEELLDSGDAVTPRDVRIEEVLGRDPVPVDATLLGDTLAGRVVMVTGAGGSIGSELCRQLLRARPRLIVAFEHSEHALYELGQTLERLIALEKVQGDGAAQGATTAVRLALGSVLDAPRLTEVLAEEQVDYVFHAAAYKHVPLLEDNAVIGIRNNVLGTVQAAHAAIVAGCKKFILVSTDKAVRPTNVMGASKRLCELVVQALAAEDNGTIFAMVRFGNVLGSSGSVFPLFRRQLDQGGPLTVTHPDITRYFMTIPEAAQLVVHAGAMATGGEVFVLDMGEPVRIAELARRMIRLRGLRPKTPDGAGDIEIAYTGLRPGEKLYEELFLAATTLPSRHPRIQQAQEPFLSWLELSSHLTALQAAFECGDEAAAKAVLAALVEGFGEARGATAADPQAGVIEGASSAPIPVSSAVFTASSP